MSLKTTVQTKLKSKQDFTLPNNVFLYLKDTSEKPDVYPKCSDKKELGEAPYSKKSLFYASGRDYTSGFIDRALSEVFIL